MMTAIILVLCHFLGSVCALFAHAYEILGYGPDRPGRLYRESWGTQLQFIHLLNLTHNLCKDAMYKLRMADTIQEDYKNSLSYELGLLASGIMDKFKHMLRVYRYYSNHKAFKAHDHSVDEIMNGYAIMQSDYNEIRAERDLYLEVLENHRKRKEAEDRMIEKYVAKNPGLSADRIKEAKEKGLKLPTTTRKSRRSMNVEGNFTKFDNEEIVAAKRDGVKLYESKKAKTQHEWIKESNNTKEAEYKKKLRYIMWAESWKGFNPETEGINIADPIARVGLANESNFLLKELKGNI